MKYKITTLLTLCCVICYGQYEPESKHERVEHSCYSLDYNEEHEQPNWVYYTLTPEDVADGEERSNSFKADPKVSTGSASLADYTKSGYDRGHLAPAGDMTRSVEAMRESFYMSNMSPQAPSFNRGIWRSCESFVRELATDSLYVVTGPIFRDTIGTIGPNKVTIPGNYYKVAYSPSRAKMWAFVIPNKKGELELEEYQTSVDEVEELIEFDLFYQLPDSLEFELERDNYKALELQ